MGTGYFGWQTVVDDASESGDGRRPLFGEEIADAFIDTLSMCVHSGSSSLLASLGSRPSIELGLVSLLMLANL